MNRFRLLALLGVLAALCARAGAEERNAWPVRVAQQDESGAVIAWEGLGPLLFGQTTEEGGTVAGFRPFYVRRADATGLTTRTTVLYPVFIYRADSERYKWTVLNLITGSRPQPGAVAKAADPTKAFDFWIFWFSRETGSPETSYHAFFPVLGTIKYRFGFDRLTWVLWPVYLRSESKGTVTTSTPWPFLRVTQGTEQGFALWPLLGWRDRPERFHRTFFLWPLGWNNTIQPAEDAPAGTAPERQVGFIPFYTRLERPGFLDQNVVWPFFGHTERTLPTPYHESRYLWPFLVQGRGENLYVNRWAPFYTHSIRKGVDKTWVLWPVLRQASWTEGRVTQTKTQFLYFVYWSLEQHSRTNPRAAPAERTHLWPLFSRWDNGAGRRQFQLLSPLEVFFPGNEPVRDAWTPLFALYRSDERAPDDRRWSALWGALTWRRQPDGEEFHLGPLLRWQRRAGERNGHVFWFDFQPKPDRLPPASR